MLDLNPQIAGDRKLEASPRLHLVKEAAGSSVASVRNSLRDTETAERQPCQIFDVAPGSGDLDAGQETIGKAGVQPRAYDDEERSACCCGSIWIRVCQTFKRQYQIWVQERRRREMIAYYRKLPDWVLRDIGMERGQISYIVRIGSSSSLGEATSGRRPVVRPSL
jgi:hypothetical protein